MLCRAGRRVGIASHGLLRLPYYLRHMQMSGYPADADLETVTDSGPMLALHGNGGLGHWQLWDTAGELASRCPRYGIAAASVAHSGHCGALGLYTVPDIRAGQLTLAFFTGPAVMPAGAVRNRCFPPRRSQQVSPRSHNRPLSTWQAARLPGARSRQPPRPAIHSRKAGRSARPATPSPIRPRRCTRLLSPGRCQRVRARAAGRGVCRRAGRVESRHRGSGHVRRIRRRAPQRIGHVLIALDPTRFVGSDALDRLHRLACSVAATGGRLPGSTRVLPDEVGRRPRCHSPKATRTALREWAPRSAWNMT